MPPETEEQDYSSVLKDIDAEIDRQLAAGLLEEEKEKTTWERVKGAGPDLWNRVDQTLRSADIPLKDTGFQGFLKRRMKDVSGGVGDVLAIPGMVNEFYHSRVQPGMNIPQKIAAIARGGAEAIYENVPESAIAGAIAGGRSAGVPGALVGGVLGPWVEQQGKQISGREEDTPILEDVDKLVGQVTRAGAGELFATGGAKAISRVASGVERRAAPLAGKLKAFLDPDQQRMLAFTDNPQALNRGRGWQTMKEDLKRPNILSIIEKNEGDFIRTSKDLDDFLNTTGQKIDNLIETHAAGRTVRLKEIDFSDMQSVLSGQSAASVATAAPVADVFIPELKGFARRASSEGLISSKGLIEFNDLLDKQASYFKAARGAEPLTKQESSRLADLWENRVGNLRLDAKDLRSYKTDYDNHGKYNRLTDPDAIGRADIYRDLGSSFRKKIGDLIGNPEDFVQANQDFGVASQLYPLAMRRAAEQRLRGQYAATQAFAQREQLGDMTGQKMSRLYPERDIAKSRIAVSTTDPYKKPIYAGPRLRRALASGTEMGAAGVSAIAKATGEAVASPLAAGIFGIGQNIDRFAEGLPRNTKYWDVDTVSRFLLDTATRPEAQIAQGMVAQLEKANQARDARKAERIVSDMSRIFPEIFEPGLGINDKLFYPDEQEDYMKILLQGARKGTVDSTFLNKQREVFKEGLDPKIIPLQAEDLGYAVRDFSINRRPVNTKEYIKPREYGY